MKEDDSNDDLIKDEVENEEEMEEEEVGRVKREAGDYSAWCDECGKAFKGATLSKSRYSLKLHILHVHEGRPRTQDEGRRRPVACDVCGKLVTGMNLKAHLRTHQKNQRATFKCEICEKDFVTRSNLRKHILFHYLFIAVAGDTSSGYVPGTPGASWTDEEVKIVQEKVR